MYKVYTKNMYLHKNPTSLLINLSLSHRTIHHLFISVSQSITDSSTNFTNVNAVSKGERGRKEERKRKKEEENSR